jgi:hypothetical protein
LTDAQEMLINFTGKYLTAPMIVDRDEVYYKIDAFDVNVYANKVIENIISKERLKNKLELFLRSHNVPINEKSTTAVWFSFDGLWDSGRNALTYDSRIELTEPLIIVRKGDFRRAITTIWKDGSFGYAGSAVVESALLKNAEEMAEAFTNKFLAARDKYK